MHYENVPAVSISVAEAALIAGNYEALATYVIGVALHEPDAQSAIAICLKSARVGNSVVRGNAILGFGHLARRFGKLESKEIKPVVVAGLKDSDSYVRGQSHAAADDLEHFLGWHVHGQADV
jgi:hypothetical protein